MGIVKNVGTADRIVRLVVGVSLMVFGAVGLFPGVWNLILPLVGLIVALTGAVGFCALYRVLGLNRPGR